MNGAELIAAERQRQIEVEGRDSRNDDLQTRGELAQAAKAYLESATLGAVLANPVDKHHYLVQMFWPHIWEPQELKPSNAIRDLVKAGALIAAEIDRLQRKES